MARPFLAMAALAPAAPLDQRQRGGQNGPARLKLLEAGLQMAGDEGGMFGDFKSRGGGARLRHDGYVLHRIR
jgi:hypothetical protein